MHNIAISPVSLPFGRRDAGSRLGNFLDGSCGPGGGVDTNGNGSLSNLVVDVALAAQERGDGGNNTQDGGQVEDGVQAGHEGAGDGIREEGLAEQEGLAGSRQGMQHLRRQQRRHRVVAEEGSE